MAGKTLYDKLFDSHLVRTNEDGSSLIYIDRQVLHEVTSPQAFEGLRLAGRKDRKSTRLNSSHITISYAVFCLKKKRNYCT